MIMEIIKNVHIAKIRSDKVKCECFIFKEEVSCFALFYAG